MPSVLCACSAVQITRSVCCVFAQPCKTRAQHRVLANAAACLSVLATCDLDSSCLLDPLLLMMTALAWSDAVTTRERKRGTRYHECPRLLKSVSKIRKRAALQGSHISQQLRTQPHSCHFRFCLCLVCFRTTTNKTQSILVCRNNAAPVGHSRPPVTSKVSGS